MREIKTLHRDAMEHTDAALAAQLNGNKDQALLYFQQAYKMESQAAALLANDFEAEPTRSVLLRSAASLALDCKLVLEAEKLICTALTGNPPEAIAEELRDLLEQVHFQRHLELRGITLHDNEFQMSIAGNAIGYGIAPTDAFLDRVEKTETLLYRTAERKLNKPYRDRGRREKALQENLELYMTAPRAASFAVTFKVGGSDQINMPGMSLSEEIIDELLECLDIFTRGDEEKLKKQINEEAYYRNFTSLARGLAPDGEIVKVVGFTTLRRGEVKKVTLVAKNSELLLKQPTHRTVPDLAQAADTVQVSGTLKMADSRKKGKDEIQIIDSDNVRHTIIVPPGMMSDIVKPLWETQVLVTGIQKGEKISLQDIRPIGPKDQDSQ